MRQLAVLLLAVAGACQPTGVSTCDRNLVALVVAVAEGYRFDCTPTEVSLPPNKDGWADHEHRMLYVRPDLEPNYVTWVMWHELGHAVWENRGFSNTQSVEEWWVAGWSWCHMPLPGFSYVNKPINCSPYSV